MRGLILCVALCLAAPVLASEDTKTGASKKKNDPCRVETHTDSLVGCATGSLERKWQWAEEDGLRYLKDDREFLRLQSLGILVPLEDTPHLRVSGRHVPLKWRFVLPWTKAYLEALAAEFHGVFGRPLQVNSAVRTVAYQKAIARENQNAIVDPPPHTTGATVDLAILTLAPEELGWLQMKLLADEAAGRIEATEETIRRCFDIMVRRPADWATVRTADLIASVLPEKKSARAPKRPAKVNAARQTY